MDIQEKRSKIIDWINTLDTDMLHQVEDLKKSQAAENEIVIYSSEGKGLTRKEYVDRVEQISKAVEEGAKTYSSQEVKDYVLNKKR